MRALVVYEEIETIRDNSDYLCLYQVPPPKYMINSLSLSVIVNLMIYTPTRTSLKELAWPWHG